MRPSTRCATICTTAALLLSSAGCPQSDDDPQGGETDAGASSGAQSSDSSPDPETTAGSQSGGNTDSGPSETSAGETGEPGTGGGSTGGELDCEALPTFERDIVPILDVSCGSADVSCHERTAYSATFDQDCRGWLALENAPLGAEIYAGPTAGDPTGCPDLSLYDRLLDLDAWTCEMYDPRARYVVPCDPESSYLYRKLVGDVCNIDNGGKNQFNIPSLTMPIDPYELSEAGEQMIYDWIARGAPRDGEGCESLCGEGDGEVGSAPSAAITHPGDGEMRVVGATFPLIGEGLDPEDGELGGASMRWASSVDGALGSGATIDWTPTSPGEQDITLTVEDSDGNTTTDAVTLTIVGA